MNESTNTSIAVSFFSLLAVLGVILLFIPHKVRRLAIRYPTQSNAALRRFVESDAYIWNVRIVGLCSIAAGLFFLWALSQEP